MPVYSHTQLETFRICPKKYEFRYILKPEVPEVATAETILGSTVHKTLSRLFQDVQMEKIPALPEVENNFDEFWKKEWHSGLRMSGDYDAGDYHRIGLKCLRDFYQHHHPFNQSRTLGLDYKATVSLDESGRYKMTGFIDRLAKSPDETYEIHDFKTGKNLPTQADLESDQQLTLYNLLVRQLWPQVNRVRSIWHFLRFDELLETVRTPEQVEEAKQKVMQRIDEVEAARAAGHFPTKVSDFCGWCDYKHICPAWKHLFWLEEEKEKIADADQGKQMVDELARLKADKVELEARIEQVREIILEFARQNGLTALFGSGQIAQIKDSEWPRLPDRKTNPQAREALEKLLKEHNLWEKAAEVSRFKLDRILKDRTLPEEVRKKLRTLAPVEKQFTVSVLRRKDELVQEEE
ncbi:MAG TPA: PD-(D/E)XK nuclease family protein [Verrucomicrobiae bacterium]|nr:PD-(D/E)XK nuclease family protein [Verrucomicrobiae bacterium]